MRVLWDVIVDVYLVHCASCLITAAFTVDVPRQREQTKYWYCLLFSPGCIQIPFFIRCLFHRYNSVRDRTAREEISHWVLVLFTKELAGVHWTHTHTAAYLYIALHVFLVNIHHCHAASSAQHCQGIICHQVQPQERHYTSHLVFQLCTSLSPPRKHAPLFLFHNMFTRVDCLITATSSTLYSRFLVSSQWHKAVNFICILYI